LVVAHQVVYQEIRKSGIRKSDAWLSVPEFLIS